MGNVLVSASSATWFEWNALTVTLTALWSYIVLRFLFMFVVDKPWGSYGRHVKAIEANNERRRKGFEEFAAKVAGGDKTKRAEILSKSLLELRDSLQRDEFTAVEVLEAYIDKALSVNIDLNCCTEVIREAFEDATEADRRWSGQAEKPPLYGVPFSVKGNFYMKSYDCTVGLAKFIGMPKDEECSMVTHLRSIGAVPFVLTNVPQGLLSFVCSNSVYGTSRNPHNALRSPGGSSGGEGALVGAYGTPFGTGSDLAGSLRIPAIFCGVISLKPTQDRFVVTGSHGGTPGRGRLGLSFGFFTHSVDEQVELLSLCMGTESYRKVTPLCPLMPLRREIYNDSKPLKIGYFEDDGFCAPVPAMRRVVNETVERLRAQGHEMIRFKIPDVTDAVSMFYKLLMADNGAYCRSLYANDVVDEHLKAFVTLLGLPMCIRWLAASVLTPISPQFATIAGSYMKDISDVRAVQEQCDDYRKKFLAYWRSLGVDIVVCPAFIVPSVEHKYPADLGVAGAATGIWNLLDVPAGVVPTGTVTEADDRDLMDEKKFPVGMNFVLKKVREAAANSAGMPTAVHVVALPFEEELCLRGMKEVEAVWKEDGQQ